MGRDWDDLMTPEPTKRNVEKYIEEAQGEDKLESHLGFENAKGVRTQVGGSTITDAKEDVENKMNEFIAGGCMPEGDQEIKCKFNLGEVIGTGEQPAGGGNADVSFTGSALTIEDADQAKSSKSEFVEGKSGIAIVSDGDYIFCESNGESLVCDRFERPKNALTLKKRVEGGIISGKDELRDIERKERKEVKTIKFPERGKVFADKKKDLVAVNL